jgi:glucose dehydrogenase
LLGFSDAYFYKAPDGGQIFMDPATGIPCDYVIPAPADGSVDPNKVNVRVTSPTQVTTNLLNVANASACAAGVQTWYYDAPATPTRVVMCPSTCDALHQQGAKIELVFGCATQIYMPK